MDEAQRLRAEAAHLLDLAEMVSDEALVTALKSLADQALARAIAREAVSSAVRKAREGQQ
jgi:hypothetical protein